MQLGKEIQGDGWGERFTFPLATEWMAFGLTRGEGLALTLNCCDWLRAAFCAIGLVGFRSSSRLMSLWKDKNNFLRQIKKAVSTLNN